MWTSSLLFFFFYVAPPVRSYNGGGQQNREGEGWGGRRSQEVGAWLFPEIGLAATLHLHCGDRREGEGEGVVVVVGGCFSLRPLLETTQQVNSRFTVVAPGESERREGRGDKNTLDKWIREGKS